MKTNWAAIFSAIFLIVMGGLVCCGWYFHLPFLVQFHANSVGMVANVAVSFILMGILLLISLKPFPLQYFFQFVLSMLILLLAILSISQDLFTISIGVDHWFTVPWLKDTNPNPGRMAPNTSIAFIIAAMIGLLNPFAKNKSMGITIQLLTLAILLLALVSLLVYSLKLEFIFSWYSFTRMAVSTSLGFAVVSIGWWSIWRQSDWYHNFYKQQEDKKILFISGAILVCFIMISGLGSVAGLTYFNLMSLNRTLEDERNQRTAALLNDVDDAQQQSISLAQSPKVQARLQNIAEEDDKMPISNSSAKFSALQLWDATGKMIFESGQLVNPPTLVAPLKTMHEATLLWKNGFYMQITIPIYTPKSHHYLGYMTTETPLIKFNQMYNDDQGLGEIGETIICWRNLEEVNCFPTRKNANGFTMPLHTDISTPFDNALNGQIGVINALTYPHKLNVIAAYAPIASLGLIMIVQLTTEEIYKPVHEQLQIIIPMALLIIICGLGLLYYQVVPLVRKVINSEQKLVNSNKQLAFSLEQLNQRNQEVLLLRELSAELQSCPTADDAYLVIAYYGARLLKYFAGVLFIMADSQPYLESCLNWGMLILKESRIHIDDCLALRHGSLRACNDPHKDLICKHSMKLGPNIPAYLCIPLLAQGKVMGLLYLEWQQKKQNADLQLLAVSFAEQIALALSNINLRENLRIQSLHDPLTGLRNRRFLDEALEMELSRAKRKTSTLALLMIDIDHFKQFNDEFGHEAGDEVLKAVATILEKNIRTHDFACRFGGEEFLIVLSEVNTQIALERAKYLNQAVSQLQLDFHSQALGTITISVGLAMYPQDGHTANDIIAAADTALYHAKKTGRNKVFVFKDTKS